MWCPDDCSILVSIKLFQNEYWNVNKINLQLFLFVFQNLCLCLPICLYAICMYVKFTFRADFCLFSIDTHMKLWFMIILLGTNLYMKSQYWVYQDLFYICDVCEIKQNGPYFCAKKLSHLNEHFWKSDVR